MKMYTPEEAADVLRVKAETIRRWARSGKLTGALLGGGVWRFTEEDLQRFIDASRPRPPQRDGKVTMTD